MSSVGEIYLYKKKSKITKIEKKKKKTFDVFGFWDSFSGSFNQKEAKYNLKPKTRISEVNTVGAIV